MSHIAPQLSGESPSGSEASSKDQEEFGLFQALPVIDCGTEASSWETPPQSVEEYLARVRQEARRLPNVVTSDIDPRRFDARRTNAVPVEALPHEWHIPEKVTWQVLIDFLSTRVELQRYGKSLT